MMMRRIFLACLGALFALTTSGIAFAQDSEGAKAEKKGPSVNDLLERADEDARRGRYKKAIPVYKEVLQRSPDAYPAVYFNLAEITRSKKQYSDAAMLYQRYLEIVPGDADAQQIRQHIEECHLGMSKKGKLAIRVKGADSSLVLVAGIPVSSSGKVTLTLKPGKYEVVVRALDHITRRTVVEVLNNDEKKYDIALKKMSFYGMLNVAVNIEGATLKIDGKEVGESPYEPVKLEAGKHFLEFRKDGYHKWIRNIVIGRDEDYQLDVNMQKLSQK